MGPLVHADAPFLETLAGNGAETGRHDQVPVGGRPALFEELGRWNGASASVLRTH